MNRFLAAVTALAALTVSAQEAWTVRHPLPLPIDVLCLDSDGTRYLAMGYGGSIWSTTDLVAWQMEASPGFPTATVMSPSFLKHFGREFYAYGSGESLYRRNPNGEWALLFHAETPETLFDAMVYHGEVSDVLATPSGLWVCGFEARTSRAFVAKIEEGGGRNRRYLNFSVPGLRILVGNLEFEDIVGATVRLRTQGLDGVFRLTSTDLVDWQWEKLSDDDGIRGEAPYAAWKDEHVVFGFRPPGSQTLDTGAATKVRAASMDRSLPDETKGYITRSTDGGLTWKLVFTSPDEFVAAMAAYNGKYYALLDAGTVIESTDGAAWSISGHARLTGRPENGEIRITSMVGGAAGLAAAGIQGEMIVSTDGRNWSRADTGMMAAYGGIAGVIGSPDGFLVLHSSGSVWHSQNGVLWRELALPASTPSDVRLGDRPSFYEFGAWGPPGYVLLDSLGGVVVSKDLVAWSRVPARPKLQYSSLKWLGGSFVAVQGNRLWFSTDGLDWQARTLPAGHNPTDIARNASGWVVCTQIANSPDAAPLAALVLLHSTDGWNWSPVMTATSDNPKGGVSDGNLAASVDRFVYCANRWEERYRGSFTTFWWSDDGRNWQQAEQPEPVGGGRLIATPRGFVCASVGGNPMFSADGKRWSVERGYNEELRAAAAFGGRTVAVGGGGVIITRDDGLSGGLINGSVRAPVSREHPLIAGFCTSGTSAMLRALGSTLRDFGLVAPPGGLEQTFHDGRSVPRPDLGRAITGAERTALERALGAYPSLAADPVLAADVPAGGFTAVVSSRVPGESGEGLAELYVDGTKGGPQGLVVNVSGRARLANPDDVLILGFVVQGSLPRTLLVRAVGDELARYGVAQPARDLSIDVFDDHGRKVPFVAPTNALLTEVETHRVGAFDAPSAITLLDTFPLGIYTAVIRARVPGEVLGEIYLVP